MTSMLLWSVLFPACFQTQILLYLLGYGKYFLKPCSMFYCSLYSPLLPGPHSITLQSEEPASFWSRRASSVVARILLCGYSCLLLITKREVSYLDVPICCLQHHCQNWASGTLAWDPAFRGFLLPPIHGGHLQEPRNPGAQEDTTLCASTSCPILDHVSKIQYSGLSCVDGNI